MYISRHALRAATALALALALTAAGCAADDTDSDPAGGTSADPLTVVAAFYPLQFVAEQVGGDRVEVANLVPPGTEPHDLELAPQQVAELSEADLVVYMADFQPSVDEAVAQNAADSAFDAATVEPLLDGYVPIEEGVLEEDERGKDPHVWLDPIRYAAIADAVAERLGEADPDNADAFTERAGALRTELETLDGEYTEGLATCEQTALVVSHNAFGYLAQKYGLEQVAITGLTPEEEPTPQRLAEVAEFARERQVTVIFFEELVSPEIAQALAAEVGAEAQVLSPIEGVEDGEDYFSVMRSNLETLRAAQRCS